MSVRSRIAFASGAAGAVGAALVLSGRYEGSVVLAAILACSIRTSALGSLADAGPVLAGGAVRGLRARALLVPAWAIVVGVAVARSGAVALVDVRGANAVVGSALLYGPWPTVVGCWLAFAAAGLILVAGARVAAEVPGAGSAERVVSSSVARLETAGIVAEAALIVTLFGGPQVVDGVDALWWIGGLAVLTAAAWLARRPGFRIPFSVPAAATTLATAGLVLAAVGGKP